MMEYQLGTSLSLKCLFGFTLFVLFGMAKPEHVFGVFCCDILFTVDAN